MTMVTDVNLSKTMQCITFQGVGKVALSEVPTPRIIRPTDALIKVTLCSICGSDLHPFHGRETGIAKGTVVGHEFVGTVVAVGKQVTKVAVGDRVMSPFTACCGGCFYCSSGATCRCSHPEARLFGWVEEEGPAEVMKETVSEQNTGGFALHGSQAQYVRVPLADATLSKLPSAVSDEEGILLGDILSTAFFCAENGFHGSMGKGSLLQRASGEGADDTLSPTVLVVGCGPVGLLAALASKYFGAGKVG
ncbi:hypothetical protein CEUSTIGMA_g13124.t1 [Chlamydomonas eustigma]|uniref:Alcohol dehydrogenase-like N-terminal domain-containing protein n=1 Tax=Chlamydomonas eustigma TaxID=1157962 RepID=A0A250XSD6_9CHLO|nr:hypothetical protein CEUSTIGMA_g13124.t1 [Chlamydomonas eustigma]|eukprot:GAX85710.1 hypothetical protein CEUSTIGMA_g13124.t1 [Chlamydomonas eustigma]